jgi:rhodanese-related sulfurtransferase
MKKLKAVLLLMTLLVTLPAFAQEKEDKVERITVEELKAKLAQNERVVIIDVRGADYDTSNAKIKGAIRIPPADLKARLGEIPRDREIVTYCACSTDGGAVKAAETLLANGFKRVRALRGGWNAWVQATGPVDSKEVVGKN